MCWKNAFPQRSSLLFGLDQLAYECNERLLFGTIAARKEISAAIVADVKRFCHQIKTDEVFNTHTGVAE
jgi:hypothetical protein